MTGRDELPGTEETAPDAALVEALSALPRPPAPFGGEPARRFAVRRRATRDSAIGLAVVVLGVGLWMLRPPSPESGTLRARGAGTSAALTLDALVERAGEVRRLSDGPLAQDERLVFRVDSSKPGFVCLDEQTGSGWTSILGGVGQAWAVESGRNVLAEGGMSRSYRPDGRFGPLAYRARFHPSDRSCDPAAAEATLEVVWSP